MSKLPMIAKHRPKRATVPIGRPPRELAGEVDSRILDAARRLFLEQGLAGASIDEIARLARAGKPTIYARFPSKEALFEAVAMRNAANVRAGFENYAPVGATIEERLTSVGAEILKRLLFSDAIEFMRLSIAEARRVPEVASIGQMARERGVQAVARVLSEMSYSDEIGTFPALAPDRLATTTQFFADLVVGRFLLRALFGEDPKSLRTEIDTHVSRAVKFFLAACRQSNVE